MKPVTIDLFCGKGGWTNGLLEAGFEVYGFDIEPQPDYRGIFVQCDILALTANDLRQYGASFGVCNSPCEQFSVHGMKHFHPNPKYPDMGIKLFNHSRALLEELNIPYVMENVRPAQKFIGPAVHHCGPFYLWGTGVPPFLPKAISKVKSFRAFPGNLRTRCLALGLDLKTERNKYQQKREREALDRDALGGYRSSWSGSAARKAATAQAAMIPLPIARAVAQAAKQLVERKEAA